MDCLTGSHQHVLKLFRQHRARRPQHMTPTLQRSGFRSPLRYPGGKQRAAKRIADLFPSDKPLHIASPFFGGGSVELELVSRGHKITGSDFFAPVAAFWQQLSLDPERLETKVREFIPDLKMTKKVFYKLQDQLRSFLPFVSTNKKNGFIDSENAFELAWHFFVINRSSFSGATLSGGMATADRFNANAVNRLRHVDLSKIEVRHGDYWEQLFDRKRRRFRFDAIYADPPYCLQVSKLYGDQGSTHQDFDHVRFAKHMNWCRKQGAPIVISYNDCPAIRELFADWDFQSISWAYGMNSSKQSNEIILSTNF